MDAFVTKYAVEVIVLAFCFVVVSAAHAFLGYLRVGQAKERLRIEQSNAVVSAERLDLQKNRLEFHKELLDRGVLPPDYRTSVDGMWVGKMPKED